MGIKTVDEAANEATEAKRDEEAVDVTKAEDNETVKADDSTEVVGTTEIIGSDDEAADDADLTDDELDEIVLAEEASPSGIAQGAAAVVSAVLGLVSLTGGWIGTVAAARETLVGQLGTSSTASVATQIKEVYGDAWKASALWAGIFALLALIVGAVVLVRPAFGTPGKPQPVWIKSVSWAGVVLGVVGLLLAVLKYTDVLLGLPSAS
ncbi:hypothetical protein [Streptomyces pseudovenezuelae]|uniref:Integral membrane protein n=1 Tax=Streptomyces pseudovenezuelae TaxID=67350 RepID=A0ABT6LT63_9ACTN|nr:hypothetical protein [Streptomyces pseudovenezuelae]MDH6219418.1 hypothetical protein [Streptomyces pseudovenezuelae]